MQIKIGANRLERNVGPRTLDRVIRKRTFGEGDIRTEISVGRNQPCDYVGKFYRRQRTVMGSLGGVTLRKSKGWWDWSFCLRKRASQDEDKIGRGRITKAAHRVRGENCRRLPFEISLPGKEVVPGLCWGELGDWQKLIITYSLWVFIVSILNQSFQWTLLILIPSPDLSAWVPSGNAQI